MNWSAARNSNAEWVATVAVSEHHTLCSMTGKEAVLEILGAVASWQSVSQIKLASRHAS